MRIYPAVHYAMGGTVGGLQSDDHLPGLFVLGEANFSDHGANRLGASALMQGLADGYFVLPYTIGNYFASKQPKPSDQPRRVQESRGGRQSASPTACWPSRARRP
jgi:succinate dehydrogenase / fumarate reductase flavoprotein subunit